MLTDLVVRTLAYASSALVADLPEPDASDPPLSDGQPVVVVCRPCVVRLGRMPVGANADRLGGKRANVGFQ